MVAQRGPTESTLTDKQFSQNDKNNDMIKVIELRATINIRSCQQYINFKFSDKQNNNS